MEFTIRIPDQAWEQTGSEDEPRSRLLATITINGVPHHAEAYQVRQPDAEQVVADPSFSAEWRGICALQEDGGAFRTVTIKGREYVIVVSPFLN